MIHLDLLYAIFFILLINLTTANDKNHHYKVGEEVTFWYNKVGPYNNPQEVYKYYSLPFCHPTDKILKHKAKSLGVILEGTVLNDSGILVKYKESLNHHKTCELDITENVASKLSKAIKNSYWYQMYIDELPIWGMVGEYNTTDDKAYIYTHRSYSIEYNNDQIISVNLTSEYPKLIDINQIYNFTISVQWISTNKSFDKRFDKYLDFDFFHYKIHWFSIFNSFMIVLFLCGIVALILMKTLKSDYARYSIDNEDLELDTVIDESGWKQVNFDVFRAPPANIYFAAMLGIGSQFTILLLAILALVIIYDMYDERGSNETAAIVCYLLTSFIAGYISSKYYKRCGGKQWKKVMLLTASLYPLYCSMIGIILNSIAIYYKSTQALSFSTILLIFIIWLFISFPLNIIGTLIGRSTTKIYDYPCRINNIARPIPYKVWYTRPNFIALSLGLIPFASIFIEIYFIFSSFWNYKVYYLYGFILLIFLMLIIVLLCITIVATYILLSYEDYRWQWLSFKTAGMTGIYIFIYSIYYFYSNTQMSGIMQTIFYFGYMLIFSYSMYLLCGSIGYMGASYFVDRIYQNIKSD